MIPGTLCRKWLFINKGESALSNEVYIYVGTKSMNEVGLTRFTHTFLNPEGQAETIETYIPIDEIMKLRFSAV